MTESQGPARSKRPALLAVATISPLPIINGFTLRVANMLRELGAYWSITLIAPELPREQAVPHVIPGVDRIETVPMVGRMTYLPTQYDVAPLRRRVDELVHELQPEAILLWGGTEFLAFDRADLPHTVADRIDCATLTAWRQAKVAPTLRAKLSELSEVFTYGPYERKIDRSADAVVVVGEADASAMRLLGGRKNVHVISNGVELPGPGEDFGAEAPAPMAIFTGVLSYPPNVDAVRYFADQVWPRVLAQEPNAVFVAAGRAPSAEVLALASRPGIRVEANVPDIRTAISSAWLAVAPMQSGSGVKNKILEAWALSKPVIMTSLAANGLDLDRQAASLVADRPQELANLVVELLRDVERRRALGLAGRELVRQHHSWEGVGRRMDALLRDGGR